MIIPVVTTVAAAVVVVITLMNGVGLQKERQNHLRSLVNRRIKRQVRVKRHWLM
ncbi:hypothetical protein ECHHL_0962 [Ehrlichia chaffeensis str. Heartland]|uniref:Uncharacterized protein n=1 Tax=Ehrlichia chaffeensis (strain ATCC CRL-10679 / Arkansas) TaxID=205920 RepID=Q2GHZ6_EHRCR|nr:hypothetical protein [Ehrlichia chaffeensis]ABD45458.1 hypothetical protein ECH_0109 [Ehrlichia chaffeensis str. Arkansas]AHX04091.1 hypothetical protein ECHHL_0962 [Ehrlichia chaffeensis str. Heartland]AHX06024.1 hypothetical protein ECHJAX_0978 [Ehrlichia chaffeensis str. Jax]AHX07014.1 hypothetical protein ECHLIB_0981 [Ehrlichia chaffeensis str. Liberty]AHX07543.1 hypothetical protein ECHOSC_0975 [Ehrlichia chaffeensis str. Osceola]